MSFYRNIFLLFQVSSSSAKSIYNRTPILHTLPVHLSLFLTIFPCCLTLLNCKISFAISMRLRSLVTHFLSSIKKLPRCFNVRTWLILVSTVLTSHLGFLLWLTTLPYVFLKLVVNPFLLHSFTMFSWRTCNSYYVSAINTVIFYIVQIMTATNEAW